MRNKSYSADFGKYQNNYYGEQNGMGDWLSDLKNNLEREVQNFSKNFESQASDWLKLQTQSLPPEVRKQLEAEIQKGGAKSMEDLKAMAQRKALEYAQAQAKAKMADPATQNTAIASSVEAGAKELSDNLISLKNLLMAGQYKLALTKHPILYGVPLAITGLIGLKAGVALTRFVVGKNKMKSNPFKKKSSIKRKFKIRKIK